MADKFLGKEKLIESVRSYPNPTQISCIFVSSIQYDKLTTDFVEQERQACFDLKKPSFFFQFDATWSFQCQLSKKLHVATQRAWRESSLRVATSLKCNISTLQVCFCNIIKRFTTDNVYWFSSLTHNHCRFDHLRNSIHFNPSLFPVLLSFNSSPIHLLASLPTNPSAPILNRWIW